MKQFLAQISKNNIQDDDPSNQFDDREIFSKLEELDNTNEGLEI